MPDKRGEGLRREFNPRKTWWMSAFGARIQPVDVPYWLNRSAEILVSSVFRGRSLSCLPTAFRSTPGHRPFKQSSRYDP